jgi:hypothetical protein
MHIIQQISNPWIIKKILKNNAKIYLKIIELLSEKCAGIHKIKIIKIY